MGSGTGALAGRSTSAGSRSAVRRRTSTSVRPRSSAVDSGATVDPGWSRARETDDLDVPGEAGLGNVSPEALPGVGADRLRAALVVVEFGRQSPPGQPREPVAERAPEDALVRTDGRRRVTPRPDTEVRSLESADDRQQRRGGRAPVGVRERESVGLQRVEAVADRRSLAPSPVDGVDRPRRVGQPGERLGGGSVHFDAEGVGSDRALERTEVRPEPVDVRIVRRDHDAD
ncbi:hypothetical protein BRC94_09085 [Halobacteriales archaeon QS_5_70_17]|nr:MAG: hypothetical protein BRC94_09085 [Halobacteriales archaeon QS_5_70_17]